MKTKQIKQVVLILLIVAGVLMVTHLEYKEVQEDTQAQVDCRVQDTEY